MTDNMAKTLSSLSGKERADGVDVGFSEEDCVEFFYQWKWPDGYRCPQCDHSRAYTIRTRRLPLYECQSCGHQTTITAGTVMENSHLPLQKWRTAMLLVAGKGGVNAVQLAERICVAYRTAWNMLRKIRQAISKMDESRLLRGSVFADTHIYRRKTLQQAILIPGEFAVVAWKSERDRKYDYFKLKLVPGEYMDGKTLTRNGAYQLALQHVQPGTSGIQISRNTSMFEIDSNSLYNKARAWVASTFHGVSLTYVQSYWDEYCFRINQSFCEESALDALCRICLCSRRKPVGLPDVSYTVAA